MFIDRLYRSVGPVQRIITTGKSVVLDYDSISRDSKAFSKELYTWGQGEDVDLKDGMYGALHHTKEQI